jgi:hypothetical protein
MLLERIPLAGIARVLSLSESSLQEYVNQLYEQVHQKVEVVPKEKGKLTSQMDELWSFVDDKKNKQWVWLAIDADTRKIIGCYIGDSPTATLREQSFEISWHYPIPEAIVHALAQLRIYNSRSESR